MRVLYIGETNTITHNKQYDVINSFSVPGGNFAYAIKNDNGTIEGFLAASFIAVDEIPKQEIKIEDIPLLELISRTRRNLDRIEFMVRKESR